MSIDLISYVKPGRMFLTTNGEIVTADEKGVYMAPYDNIYMVKDEYEHEYTEEDIEEVFEYGLNDTMQVYDKVQTDYRYDDNSLCPAYFDFQIHSIPKIDLLLVYAELQSDINDDYVVVVEPITFSETNIKPKVLGNCNNKTFLQQMVQNGNLKGLDGTFTGNMKDFLTELENNNPCLCRFIEYDANLDDIITDISTVESVGFFRKDTFTEIYCDVNKEGEYDYES